MKQPLTIKRVLGGFAKWIAIVTIFGFSLIMSLQFFTAVLPPGKAMIGLSLTEGGFILWMCVFMLTPHEAVGKAIALVMTAASAFVCLLVAGYEFYKLMSAHYDLAQDAQMIQIVSTSLIVIFALHFAAFIIDMFASYFSKPGHSFSEPTPAPQYAYQEVREDVRTTEPMQLAQGATVEGSLTQGDSTSQDVVRTRKAKREPKEPGFIKRYISGMPINGQHGRDCACSSCRPDLHPSVPAAPAQVK